MADYSFGGTDEENAELKKLHDEVVSIATSLLPGLPSLMILSYSSKILTVSKSGKSLSVLQKP